MVDEALDVLGLEVVTTLNHLLKSHVSNGFQISVVDLADDHHSDVAADNCQNIRLPCQKE